MERAEGFARGTLRCALEFVDDEAGRAVRSPFSSFAFGRVAGGTTVDERLAKTTSSVERKRREKGLTGRFFRFFFFVVVRRFRVEGVRVDGLDAKEVRRRVEFAVLQIEEERVQTEFIEKDFQFHRLDVLAVV